ncbi:hypothetical protein XH99_24935 [Bradyrhizobium nanningense]|uniref:DUF304 domain-containing protein n=1 Tax=Bradyrhizobium nanningense TaxID=1325118 RepID=A0A4V1L1K7_9BRAD|nr:hypothetical protein [Bradyrhizobium nanningense]RXH25278.1 hypothetical protein XH99_24935 [Bradyrhizobium nanningense]RXH27289.1 hypothetical protein XH84_28085 [Bradyrhizobium nanningense]
MAGAMTVDGTIRIDRPMPWVGRLLSLPLLAASGYLLWNVALGLRQDFFGFGRLADDLVPVLVFAGLGLLVGIPGIILLTFRYFVVLNETLRQIVITRQFGPLNIRSSRDLADYHFVSITDDYDPQATTYDVNLCGNKGTEPITLQSFTRRDEADELASEIGRLLKLPARDYVGTEPDAD